MRSMGIDKSATLNFLVGVREALHRSCPAITFRLFECPSGCPTLARLLDILTFWLSAIR